VNLLPSFVTKGFNAVEEAFGMVIDVEIAAAQITKSLKYQARAETSKANQILRAELLEAGVTDEEIAQIFAD